MRRGDRRADGGRNAARPFRRWKNARRDLPARRFCRSRSRSRLPGFRARKARPKWTIQKVRSVACRPYLAGGSPAILRISLPPHRHVVHGGQAIFHRSPSRRPHRCDRSSSFQAYFSLLRADADHEIEHLINSFTVNETYFYREDHQLRCMTSSLLAPSPAQKKPGGTVRIWSIPCSTGEEPYSIALWLMENWPQVDNYNIEIVGSDIDTRALKAAAEGIYGDRALMRLSRDIVSRYFRPVADGNHQIDEGLRNSIEFTRANLIDAQDMARYRDFDLIFCRNVLIYFDDASRRQAAENLYDCLRPGGYICLGPFGKHEPDIAAVSAYAGFPTRSSIKGRRRIMVDVGDAVQGAGSGRRRFVAGAALLPLRT